MEELHNKNTIKKNIMNKNPDRIILQNIAQKAMISRGLVRIFLMLKSQS